MNDGHKKVLQSMKMLCRVLTIIVVTAVMVSWFVWGPFGLLFYTGGLLNATQAFVLSIVLSSMVSVIVICALVLAAHTVFRWSRLDAWRKGGRVFAEIVLLAWPVSYGLESGEIVATPPPFDLFVCGLTRYIDRRVDIGAIQNWLGTVDPNDCEDRRLEVGATPKGSISDSSDSVPAPPSLARLGWYNMTLRRDDKGRPMIRITLGGGGLIGCWGLDVGAPDMPMPASASRFLYYPFAPGAYIWSSD
jgi:hypothetical protein